MRPVDVIRFLPARSFGLRVWNRFTRLRGPHVVRTIFGAKMRCDAHDIVQATICHFGAWEPEATRALTGLLKVGDTAVDLGANVGYYSLLFSGLVGPQGRVIAVEAHPAIADKLRGNIALNNFDNIRVENVAVAAQPGTVTLYEAPAGNIGMTSIDANRGFTKAIEVPASTLLSLIAKPENVTLIKCDIEGAELPVMADLLDNLDRFNPRLSVIVEASDSDGWRVLFARFTDAGFRAWRVPSELATMWTKLLEHREEPLIEVHALPTGQSDLLFRRV